ncbi:MAG: alpha/beta hydrolase [Leptolyngbya sp. SIO1E4]|nr:alpha/beta hydrolase [Leptolyngbya sp. SIO1E4]
MALRHLVSTAPMRQRSPFALQKFIFKWMKHLTSGVLYSGAIALGVSPALAVEQVAVQIGPLKNTIEVTDLETFSKTGDVPPRLELYRPLLTPTVQATLQNHLSLEPAIRDRVIQDLTHSNKGRPLTDLLAEVAPSLSPEVLQTALQEAAETESGVTVISLLRAIPGETLSLEGMALLMFLSQLGLSHLEQTALSNVLNHELGAHPQPLLSAPFEPSDPGSYPVERWSVSFRDHDRDRIIPIDLYWTDQTQGPLVVFSHGFGADRRFLAYLAEHLASHGLTVVALEHPGSNVDALIKEDGSLLPTYEFVERPRDVSFILDRLEDLNTNSFFLRERINLEQVTLVGHSLGGYTGLVLAGGQLDPTTLANFCAELAIGSSSPADWLQCAATDVELPAGDLADSRITQLVVMNPLAGKIFGDAGLRHVKVPTLFLTSTSDGITSVSDQQLQPFNQLSGPRALVAVIGGTHLSVGDPANINPALTQVPFMPERPEAETLRLRQYLNGAVLSFVMQQTDMAKQYQPFLSSDYTRLFSTPTLPIRYSDRLPSSVSRWLSSREMLNRRLTPTLKSIASLLHLEFIDAQHRVATLHQGAIAQFPLSPLDLYARLPRSPALYQAAHNQANHESSHQAKSRL